VDLEAALAAGGGGIVALAIGVVGAQAELEAVVAVVTVSAIFLGVFTLGAAVLRMGDPTTTSALPLASNDILPPSRRVVSSLNTTSAA
jgi:hypothetical protein